MVYIEPFWAGVLSTLAAEFLTVLIAAIIVAGKEDDK